MGPTSYEQCIARETGVEPGGERPRGSNERRRPPPRRPAMRISLLSPPRTRGPRNPRALPLSFKTSPGCAPGLPLSRRRHRREIEPGPWPKTCVKICARSRSGENGRRLPWTILSFRRALLGIPFKRRARPKLPRSTIFGRPDAVSSPASSLPGALGPPLTSRAKRGVSKGEGVGLRERASFEARLRRAPKKKLTGNTNARAVEAGGRAPFHPTGSTEGRRPT